MSAETDTPEPCWSCGYVVDGQTEHAEHCGAEPPAERREVKDFALSNTGQVAAFTARHPDLRAQRHATMTEGIVATDSEKVEPKQAAEAPSDAGVDWLAIDEICANVAANIDEGDAAILCGLVRHAKKMKAERDAYHKVALVDRKLLDDALGQIEETWLNDYPQCTACTAEWNSGEVDHRPDCRYVRVADALWRALK